MIFSGKALGRVWGFVAGWALLLDYIVTTSIFALAAVGYLGYFFPVLQDDPYFGISSFMLVFLLVILNSVGVKESANFSAALVLTNVVGITLVLAIGYSAGIRPFWTDIHFGTNPKIGDFLYGTSLAMAAFLGIEVISQASEETRIAGKTIPRAIMLVSIAVITFSIGFSSLAVGVVPLQLLSESFKDPAAIVASRLPFGNILGILLGFMGLTVCTVATNAGIIGVSRITYSMSKNGLLPARLGVVNRRTGTPIRAIIIFGTLQLLLAYSGHIGLAADLYNFGALLAYMLVNISLVVLRNREPERFRPLRLPGTFRLKGGLRSWEIPVIPVLGLLSSGAIWVIVVITHEFGRIVGFGWLAIGLTLYYGYLHSRKNRVTT